MSDRDPAAIEAEIEAQREQLAHTVDQLTHKLDPKAQARERAADLKERATTPDGKPRPELVGVLAGLAAFAAALMWWRRR